LNLHTRPLGTIVLAAGMVSGILGVVYALGQHDIKRLLAYHSVENIGIILIGIGIGMIGVEAGNPIMAVLGFSGGPAACAQPFHIQIPALHGGRHGAAQNRNAFHRSMPWAVC
jgi:NADH:ubiquinone oxidoreductase subunit 2 (subunit N)